MIVFSDKNSDIKLFDEIHDTYYNYAYKICYNILESENAGSNLSVEGIDIDDILQESFLKVWIALNEIKNGSYSPKILVGAVVRNTTIDAIRTHRTAMLHTIDLPDDAIQEKAIDYNSNPLDSVIIKEAIEETYQGIMKLGKKYSDIFLLIHKCDLSIQQIAEVLGVPTKTIYTRYERGKKKLQNIILANQKGVVEHGR